MRHHGLILFTVAALVGLLPSATPAARPEGGPRSHEREPEPNTRNMHFESGTTDEDDDDPNVVGWITATGNASGLTPAIWPNGASTPTLLPGTPFGEATSINNKGTVTGTLLVNFAPQAF